jgi:hypothetical protein
MASTATSAPARTRRCRRRRTEIDIQWMPRAVVLDEIGHKAVMVGFTAMALTIILGATMFTYYGNLFFGGLHSYG